MSYSRWSSSAWYTFWSVSSGDARDEQVLAVWLGVDDRCELVLPEVLALQPDRWGERFPAATLEQLRELAEDIVPLWLADVDAEYPP